MEAEVDPDPPLADDAPDPPPEGDSEDRLAQRLAGVERSLLEIRDAVQEQGAVLASELTAALRAGSMIDRLHEDNQRLRQGELDAALMPVLREVMRVADDAARLGDRGGDDSDAVLLHDALVDALARAGLERYVPDDGASFDPAEHTARRTVRTDEIVSDLTIGRVFRAGYRREDGRVVRTAEVEVRRVAGPDGGADIQRAPQVTETSSKEDA